MSDIVQTNNSSLPSRKTDSKKKRSLPRRIIRFFTYLGLTFILLIALAIGVTETKMFRSWLRDTVVEAANTNLNATLSIAEIKGNIFSGFTFENINLRTPAGEFVFVRSLIMRYDIFQLPYNYLRLNELTLNEPDIFLRRSSNGVWNFEHLSKDTSSSTSSPLKDWTLVFGNVRINAGHIVVYDSTAITVQYPNRFSTANLELQNLNLSLSAIIRDQNKKVSINQCSYENEKGEFAIQNLAGDILVTNSIAELDKLSIQTNRSAFQITAKVDSVDVFTGFSFDEFGKKHLKLQFNAPKIDVRDLQYFLPALDILGSTVSVQLEADGSLQDLSIQTLILETPKSLITMAGRILDIDKGADLTIKTYSDKCIIDPDELPKILPGIPLPDYSGVGIAKFSKLSFDGKPLFFAAEVEMISDAGEVQGTAHFDITKKDIIHHTKFVMKKLDLSKIFLKPSLNSSLNCSAEIDGVGFTPGAMFASAQIEADSSTFAQYGVRHISLTASANPSEVSVDVASDLEKSQIDFTGKCGFIRDSVTSFQFRADASTLDLGKLLDDEKYRSELTFHLEGEGNGLDMNRSSGHFIITLDSSRYKDRKLDPDTVTLFVDQQETIKKSISLKTRYADAEVSGIFELNRIIRFLSATYDSLQTGVEYFSLNKNSTRTNLSEQVPISKSIRKKAKVIVEDSSRFMDAKYKIQLKKPELILKYMEAETFLLRGIIEGTISGGYAGMNFNGELRVPEFYFRDTSQNYLAAGISFRYFLNDVTPHMLLDRTRMGFNLIAQDMYFNGVQLSKTNVQFRYSKRSADVSVRSIYDTSLTGMLDANLEMKHAKYNITIPKLTLDYLGSIWKNRGPISARIDTNQIVIDEFDLMKENMLISLTGTRTHDGQNNLKFVARRLQLRDIEFVLTKNKSVLEGSSFTGLAGAEVRINGSDTDPIIALYFSVDSLAYRNLQIGTLTAEGTYSKRMLEIYSEMFYRRANLPDKKILFISGLIPVNLSSTATEEMGQKKTASLTVQMNDFPLSIFEKTIGLFTRLDGSVNADLQLSGTADNPDYSGILTIDNGRGLLKLNNMTYLMNAKIEPKEHSIYLRDGMIRNEDQDWKEGLVTAIGKLDIENFSIKQFWVTTKGKLKILKPASRSATKFLYGDLYVATGDEGLTYSGRIDRSKFIGKVNITRGNLTFPPETGGTGAEKNANITYVVIDDTTKHKTTSLSSGAIRTRKTIMGKTIDDENGNESASRSILDGLGYDLTLTTHGPMRIIMPFNSLTQEELNAQLVIEDFKVNNFSGRGKFEGEILLGSDSRYTFFGKKFEASGRLIFTGSPQNPDLDLTAVYTGTRLDPTTNESRKIFIILTVAGTKSKPIVSFDIRQDAVDGTRPTLGDVQSDALSFIMTGSFTSELTSSDKGKLLEKASGLSSTLATSLVSSAMLGFLYKAGLDALVNRIELSGVGSTDPRVKVSTEIGRAIITYDGRITNLGSSEIKTEIPIGQIIQSPGLHNLMLEISRKTFNASIEGGVSQQENAVYELKVFYRFSF